MGVKAGLDPKVIYDVVRVTEKANQVRAEQLAKPEIDRARGKYREILLRLADGVASDDVVFGELGYAREARASGRRPDR